MSGQWENTRSGEERRQTPPTVHVECHMFTTEEARVAVRQFTELATPENLQLIKTWIERLKEAEKSEWKIKVRMLKLAALAGGLIVLYHFLVEVRFITWIKGLPKP